MPEVIITNMQSKLVLSPELKMLIEDIIKYALAMEDVPQNIEVSVAILDDTQIRKLNKTYRFVDAPTDVLSFSMNGKSFKPRQTQDNEDNLSDEFFSKIENDLLGDIAISLERATRQANEYGHSLEREVSYLAVHGTLHLLGYNHDTPEDKKIMRKREEEILEKYDIVRRN
jgi:probable rRNA maturation factor